MVGFSAKRRRISRGGTVHPRAGGPLVSVPEHPRNWEWPAKTIRDLRSCGWNNYHRALSVSLPAAVSERPSHGRRRTAPESCGTERHAFASTMSGRPEHGRGLRRLRARCRSRRLMATLIMTAKLNDIDPQAWLADVLARINDHPVHRLDDLLPWNWAAAMERRKVAA